MTIRELRKRLFDADNQEADAADFLAGIDFNHETALTNPTCSCGNQSWEEVTMDAWLWYPLKGFQDGDPVLARNTPKINTDGATVEIRCAACGEPITEESQI